MSKIKTNWKHFPLNSLIHNLSKNVKSRCDLYVMISAKRTCFLPTTKIWRSYKLFILNKCKCLCPMISNLKTMLIMRDGNCKHLLRDLRKHSYYIGLLWTHLWTKTERTDHQEVCFDGRMVLLTWFSGIICLDLHDLAEIFLQVIGLFKL